MIDKTEIVVKDSVAVVGLVDYDLYLSGAKIFEETEAKIFIGIN